MPDRIGILDHQLVAGAHQRDVGLEAAVLVVQDDFAPLLLVVLGIDRHFGRADPNGHVGQTATGSDFDRFVEQRMLAADFGVFVGDDRSRLGCDAVELEGARQGGPTGRRAGSGRFIFSRSRFATGGGGQRFANLVTVRDVGTGTGVNAPAATGRQ